MSEFLRRWQLLGYPPEDGGTAFWAGWLVGSSYKNTIRTFAQARDEAIKIAELIEERARD